MDSLPALTKRIVRRDPKADPRSFLYGLLPRRSVGAEIGVWTGEFSAALLRNVRPRQLHLVDPWKFVVAPGYDNAWYGGERAKSQEDMDAIYESVLRRFSKDISKGRVLVHRGSSTDVAGQDQFKDPKLDWVYIDGDHTYEAVREDLRIWWQKVKPGGLLLGDDYGAVGWWENGVQRAVDEFVSENRIAPVLYRAQQFVLRRPAMG